MGRVYEALKRAAEQGGPAGKQNGRAEQNGHAAAKVEDSTAVAGVEGNGAAQTNGNGNGGPAPEYLFQSSRHFQAPEQAPHRPAPNEHTVTRGRSALPARAASRAAGVTLGAPGSDRTPVLFTLEISRARLEPHLVAVTQPRPGPAEP